MSDFRKILDAHVRGQAPLADTEQALQESLQREAGLGPSHGALIEALYRGERLSSESYVALMARLSALQPARPTPVQQNPQQQRQPPHSGPADNDRTILRFVRLEPDISSDKTQLRVPLPPANNTTRNTTGASSWSHPSHWIPVDSAPLGPGSVIKDRFVLEEKIGQGGMGTVYKARDRRKEEAQDRNPYVAVKVLNEDFKRHPRSLQALQREARKAQALQHPNIVTVYDFDRDGTNVYMVMELLEGEPLDRLIKRHKGSGLDSAQAWQIAQEICKGMGYAHQQGIVHADFKPANAFLLNDGTVKIFDFGIARAVKQGTRAEGTHTAFDPGTLGALTPAYASREIALGQEPDARDDVYAIACVIYELLTGTHPYNGVSGDVASAKSLVAARPVRVLGRRWRTLRNALDYARSRRPATAKAMLDAFVERRKPPVLYATAGVAALAIVIVGIMVARSHFAAERKEELAAALASADATRIDAELPTLRELDPAERAALFLSESTRAGLIGHYERRIEDAVNVADGHYDFPQAETLLGELMGFFADSQAVKSIADRVAIRKQELLARHTADLESALQRGVLIDSQGTPSVTSALAIIRAVDPRNYLLIDARIPGTFAEQARVALGKANTALATELVTAGVAIDPGDSTLTRLREEVRAARVQALEAEMDGVRPPPQVPAVASAVTARPEDMTADQLRASITAGLEKPVRTISEARSLSNLLTQLGTRDEAAAAELKRTLKLKLAGDISTVRTRRGVEEAIRFADAAYALFPDSPALRKSLTQMRLAAAEAQAQQREIDIARSKRTLIALLDERSVDDAWPGIVESTLQRVAVNLSPDDPFVQQARIRVAVLYLTRAATLRQTRRLGEAARMLEAAKGHGASAASVASEEKLLAIALANQRVEQAQRDKVAQLEALKQKLLAQAEANEVVDALATLKSLREVLPRKDPFIAEQAPAAIGAAYLRIASIAARDGRMEDAIGLVGRGRSVARSTPAFARALNRYERYKAMESELSYSTSIDVERILRDLTSFAQQDAAEEAAVARWMIRKVVTRANTTTNVKVSSRLADIARRMSEHQASLTGVPAQDVAAGSEPS
jgi:serine/threonine protein kinase